MDNDTHDQLVQAYLEYFKANEKWEQKRTYRTYYAAQQWLREIRRIVNVRLVENKEYFYTNVNTKYNKGRGKS
jgi:hypothetical protein